MNLHKFPELHFKEGESYIIQSCQTCKLERKRYVGGITQYRLGNNWVNACPYECNNPQGFTKMDSVGRPEYNNPMAEIADEVKPNKLITTPGKEHPFRKASETMIGSTKNLLGEDEWLDEKKENKIETMGRPRFSKKEVDLLESQRVNGLRHIFEKHTGPGDWPCLVCGVLRRTGDNGGQSYKNLFGAFYANVPFPCINSPKREELILLGYGKPGKHQNIRKPAESEVVTKFFPAKPHVTEIIGVGPKTSFKEIQEIQSKLSSPVKDDYEIIKSELQDATILICVLYEELIKQGVPMSNHARIMAAKFLYTGPYQFIIKKLGDAK